MIDMRSFRSVNIENIYPELELLSPRGEPAVAGGIDSPLPLPLPVTNIS